MTERWTSADDLSEKSGKTKRAIYKNKNLPYRQSVGGAREYNLSDSIIKKWLKGESIRPTKPKPPAPKKQGKREAKPTKKPVTKKPAKKPAKPKPKKTPAPVAALTPTPHPGEIDIPDDIMALIESGELTAAHALGMSKLDLEKIRIYEQARKYRLETEIKRGELVNKKLIHTVFSRIYEIHLNQMLPMKDKLVPDLAAMFGVKDEKLKLKAAEKLDSEQWRVLNNIKRQINKFLERHGEEPIT